MKAVLLALSLVMLAGTVSADILEWQDGDGVRHFTNLKDEVPKAQRAAAQVLIDEQALHSGGSSTTDSESATAPPASQDAEPPRQAQVVYDQSELAEAYAAGVERGLAAVSGTGRAASVSILGPLAVANVLGPPAPYGAYDYPIWYGYPFVELGFGHSRWRHFRRHEWLHEQPAAPFVTGSSRHGSFAAPPVAVIQ